jgi:vacuolar iron transporter family protein
MPLTLVGRGDASAAAPRQGRTSLPDVARRYLGDLVYGANDGIITTFAVASGVAGADLSSRVVVILGFANLIADGLSMAASNFLAIRSVSDVRREQGVPVEPHPIRHALATFMAFGIAGAVPLLAYVLPTARADQFSVATVLTLLTLFLVGASRSLVTPTRWFRSGLEMLIVGASAAAASYGIGWLLARLAA